MSADYEGIEPIYFNSAQKQVWRAMPDEQRVQITHFTFDLAQGWASYSQGDGHYSVRSSYVIELATKKIDPIVRQMIEQDFKQADFADFPALTPKRAMLLVRLAKPIGSVLVSGGPDCEVNEDIERCGTGLTGLHLSLLGSEELILGKQSQDTLQQTAYSLYENVFNKVR